MLNLSMSDIGVISAIMGSFITPVYLLLYKHGTKIAVLCERTKEI